MADFDLGTDIVVLPDMPDTEELVTGGDCLLQDVLLRLDQPQGIADGTVDGLDYGIDLRAQRSRGVTPRALFELVVQVERQLELDDRISGVRTDRSTYDRQSQTLTLTLDIETVAGPYPLTITAAPGNLAVLQEDA